MSTPTSTSLTTKVEFQSSDSGMDSKTSTNNSTLNNYSVKKRTEDSKSLILKNEVPTNKYVETKSLSELDCETIDDVAGGTSNTKVEEDAVEAKNNTDNDKPKRGVLPKAKNKQEFEEQTHQIMKEFFKLNIPDFDWDNIE